MLNVFCATVIILQFTGDADKELQRNMFPALKDQQEKTVNSPVLLPDMQFEPNYLFICSSSKNPTSAKYQ